MTGTRQAQPSPYLEAIRDRVLVFDGAMGTSIQRFEWLLDGEGDVTLGRVGPIRCVATAATEDLTLAMLVRNPDESLVELLSRLDEAVRLALEEDIITDELNP